MDLFRSVSLIKVVRLRQNNDICGATRLAVYCSQHLESSAKASCQHPARGPLESESCLWLRCVARVHEAVPRYRRKALALPLMFTGEKWGTLSVTDTIHGEARVPIQGVCSGVGGGVVSRVALTFSAEQPGLHAVGLMWSLWYRQIRQSQSRVFTVLCWHGEWQHLLYYPEVLWLSPQKTLMRAELKMIFLFFFFHKRLINVSNSVTVLGW